MRTLMLSLALLLGLVTAAAADDIVWRVHCDFPGKGKQPTVIVDDTSRECQDGISGVGLMQQNECKAGNQKACADFKRTMACVCKPEKVQ